MSSRWIAVAAVALSFLVTAAVAVALWPDRDAADESPDTAVAQVNTAPVPEPEATGATSSDTLDPAAEPDTVESPAPAQADTQFALQPDSRGSPG